MQGRDQRIDGVGFIAEFKTGNAGRRNNGRRGFESHADEGNLVAKEVLEADSREDGGLSRGFNYIGRQVLELGTGKFFIGTLVDIEAQAGVKVGWVVAAVLHTQQFILTFVEFVVADGVEINADAVHRFDGWLILEQG